MAGLKFVNRLILGVGNVECFDLLNLVDKIVFKRLCQFDAVRKVG
jgi:hypothetical protein